jgi:filamentous hemagglutinin family protein
VLDGKFGTTGAVAGPNFNIPATVGATRGNNLFHSFSQFDLVKGDTATFSGPANIQNILARVTGGAPSSIDGTIRSEIPGANFFLMNPKGILFGPNASLDVSGSFAATTADYLKLADGARFVASIDADDSVLTTAPVAAFGFLGTQPGSLSVQQSTLSVPGGKSISLVGGNIGLDGGSLQAAAGQINVASVQAPGEIPADPSSVHVATFSQFGAIDLQNSAHLDASGDRGGRLVIRGGRLTVDNSKIEANTTGSGDGLGIDIELAGDLTLSNGGQINSLSPGGLGASGNIQVTSQSIHMDGGGAVDDFFNPTTGISAATGDVFGGGGPAKGGDVVVHTGRLEMVNSAQISSASYGAGNAGRIEVDADSVRLDAQLITPTQITANTQQFDGGGKAGDIVIRAGTFDLVNGATVLAASLGSGAAGLVDLNAKKVNILNGGIITAGTFVSGPGGNVQVTADSLRIDGRNYDTGTDNLTGIQAITTSTDAPAPGGNIQTKTGSLDLLNSGSIFTFSLGLGQGGNIDVSTKNLSLNNGASIQASGQGAGAAGNISVEASGPVLLTSQSSVNTSAPGSSGGNITVHAGSDVELFDSKISAQAGLNGGNIALTSPGLMYLRNSIVTGEADATGSGFGNGGNLTLQPSLLVINTGSLISKSSFGNGGNISILSDYFFPSDAIIDATAPFGLPGTVQVTAPEVDLSGVLAVLPANLLDASMFLRPDCGVRLGGQISSFIVMGRGGVPFAPGGFVPSAAPRDKNDQK